MLSRADSSADRAKPTVPVLGGQITPFNLDATVKFIIDMVRHRARGYVCIANVHTTTLALRDAALREALNGAAAIVADGMPVVWRVRMAGYRHVGRVYGADLVNAVSASGIGPGLRHGFLGGLEGVANAMASQLKARFPALRVAGVWNPGVIREGEKAASSLLNEINQSGCDVLWVGLGAPKQEIWMAQHRPRLVVPALIGVGQAFDILAGRTVQPPAWIGHHGLEWLYRLFHDPRRLWKRYLYYNTFFLWYVLLESIGWQPSTRIRSAGSAGSMRNSQGK